jgi:hypothetical protein
MGGVGQVSGELPVRSLVTLPAGFNDILPGKPRFGIPDGENVMGAVTIVAFGRRRITEFGYLSVEGLEIRFRYLLVATSALVNDIQFETLLIGSADGMR